MKVSKNNNKYTFIKGSFFFSLPGIISALLALVSIPIYLNQISNNLYSNFILQHFFLTISIILNFGLSKITNIEIAKNQNEKILNNKIKLIIAISAIKSITVSTLIYVIIKFFILIFEINSLYSLIDIQVLFGLIITNIYLTSDAILRGKLCYKLSALGNLIFYSFSISLPIFFCLLFEINFNFLFNISLYIKLFGLIMILFFLLKNINLFNKLKKDNFIKIYIKSYKWISINLVFHQIYNYLDKYLVKIFFSNIFFVFYSVSQQIASKLTIPFNGINHIFLTLNSKSKGSIYELINCIYLYIFLINISFYTILPLLDPALKIWLKENYNQYYLTLSLTFFLTGSIGSLSNLLLDFYDINNLSKKNFKIDSLILIPFLMMVIFAIYNNNIYLVALSILLKDVFLILIRLLPLNFSSKHKLFITSQISILALIVLFKILNLSYLYLMVMHILIFLTYFRFKNLLIFIRKF